MRRRLSTREKITLLQISYPGRPPTKSGIFTQHQTNSSTATRKLGIMSWNDKIEHRQRRDKSYHGCRRCKYYSLLIVVLLIWHRLDVWGMVVPWVWSPQECRADKQSNPDAILARGQGLSAKLPTVIWADPSTIYCFPPTCLISRMWSRRKAHQVYNHIVLTDWTGRASIAYPTPSASNSSPIDGMTSDRTNTRYSETISPPSAPSPQSMNSPTNDRFSATVEYEEHLATTTSLSAIRSNTKSSILVPAPMNPKDEIMYINFFLSELSKCFPYVKFFPWVATKLFATSSHNPSLRQSVLSVAKLIAENRLGRGHAQALDHLQKALQILQSQISTLEIDDGVAISSFLLAHFSIMLGEHLTARKHLHGMVIMLKQLNPENTQESVVSPLTIDPLLILTWRMAKRTDFVSSIACGEAPVIPRFLSLNELANISLPQKEGKIRQWIQFYTDTHISLDNADWAEAWFALDNLMHRTCHVSAIVNIIRQAPSCPIMESQVGGWIDNLVDGHHQWRERAIVRKADDIEKTIARFHRVDLDSPNVSNPSEPSSEAHLSSSSFFLDYPLMHISDYFFANRLDDWRAIQLYIGLIQQPMWGIHEDSRFTCAVDLCRTNAALSVGHNDLGAETACGLYLAGVTFGGPSLYEVRISTE